MTVLVQVSPSSRTVKEVQEGRMCSRRLPSQACTTSLYARSEYHAEKPTLSIVIWAGKRAGPYPSLYPAWPPHNPPLPYPLAHTMLFKTFFSLALAVISAAVAAAEDKFVFAHFIASIPYLYSKNTQLILALGWQWRTHVFRGLGI